MTKRTLIDWNALRAAYDHKLARDEITPSAHRHALLMLERAEARVHDKARTKRLRAIKRRSSTNKRLRRLLLKSLEQTV